MATMILDTIKTPEGYSRIEEIIRIGINQHHSERIYFFENGVTARQRTNRLTGEFISAMKFKASEDPMAWCQC